MTIDNLFAAIPQNLPAEQLVTLLVAPHVRIERIVSLGHASPEDFWYDQPHREWVAVLQGAARLRLEDRVVDLAVGDFLAIPPRCRHRIEWTTPEGPTVWLAVHLGEQP